MKEDKHNTHTDTQCHTIVWRKRGNEGRKTKNKRKGDKPKKIL